MPTRLTVDLFRAARNALTTVDVRVVRDGRRVRNAECDVVQDDRGVARATLVQYRRSSPPPGRVWTAPDASLELPTPDDGVLPFVCSVTTLVGPGRQRRIKTTRGNGSSTMASK
jgi:hypothetical protein